MQYVYTQRMPHAPCARYLAVRAGSVMRTFPSTCSGRCAYTQTHVHLAYAQTGEARIQPSCAEWNNERRADAASITLQNDLCASASVPRVWVDRKNATVRFFFVCALELSVSQAQWLLFHYTTRLIRRIQNLNINDKNASIIRCWDLGCTIHTCLLRHNKIWLIMFSVINYGACWDRSGCTWVLQHSIS